MTDDLFVSEWFLWLCLSLVACCAVAYPVLLVIVVTIGSSRRDWMWGGVWIGLGLLAALPPTAIRRVVQLFVARLEVDLETRAIELELRLPSWAMGTANAIRTACASATDLHAGEQSRHTALGVVLALLDCARQKRGRQICYACTRRRAA